MMPALTVAITIFKGAPHLESAIRLGGYVHYGLSLLGSGAYHRVQMWCKAVA